MMPTKSLAQGQASGARAPSGLSVIIVNYNVRYFLEQALLSVRRAARGLEVEVFVVDNASADRSAEMVRAKFPEVHLIENSRNVGFAVANNQAIRQSKGAYVLLLNPDTLVEEDTFRLSLTYMDEHPEAGALGVKMIDGSGRFLPESKRGFPAPWVAFCKTVGLSRLFPRSRVFNGYHLGYLDPDEIQEVDVLAGAFMLLRREALETCGLLDERFFMYGEDIDLSYRLQQAGYRNIYFPRTQIIHYKGESTRKGSLNYVRTFYQAMILFARKHFRGRQAEAVVWSLQAAIYLRAGISYLGKVLRRWSLPLLDAVLIGLGLWVLKDFWATYHFRDPNYYDETFLRVNAPLYTSIWIAAMFFSGAYDQPASLRRLLRGLLVGTLVLAAIYGFLDLAYRNSRALIVMGAGWAAVGTIGLRYVLHYVRQGHWALGRSGNDRLVIVGSSEESRRVADLLRQVGATGEVVGTVAPRADPDRAQYLAGLEQLDEVVHLYRVSDLVFCSRDVSTQAITRWMSRLGPDLRYRIVPEDSMSIIGSPSRNAPGELLTIDVQFNIAQPLQRRNKRLFDLGLALFLLLTLPVQWVLLRPTSHLLRHIRDVFRGRLSWVGYGSAEHHRGELPGLRPGLLSPEDGLRRSELDDNTRRRLDLLYAKDYSVWRDVDIVGKAWRSLGRPRGPAKDQKQARE